MLRRRILVPLFAFVLAVAGAGAALVAEEAAGPGDLLRQADRHYEQKTFKQAIEKYEDFLEMAPEDPRAYHAKIRIVRSLLALRQRHPAIQRLEALHGETQAGSLERAETAHLLGSTESGWRGGSNRVVRFLDEAAGIYREKNRMKEWTQTQFELARALVHSWDYEIDFAEWQAKHWNEDPEKIEVSWDEYRRDLMVKSDQARYDRALAIYADLAGRADAKLDDQSVKALALYRLGSLHVNVLAQAFATSAVYYPVAEEPLDEKAAQAQDRYQTEIAKGIAAWELLLAELPNDPLADDARYLIALTQHERRSDFPAAVAQYEKLLADFPRTEWSDTARNALQEIRKQEIRLSVGKPFLPGAKPKIDFAARNVESVRFSAYRIDVAGEIRRGWFLNDAERIDVSGREPVVTFTHATGVRDDHRGVYQELEFPIVDAGAYVVVAEAEDVVTRTVLVLSPTAIAVKTAGDRALVFAADAVTGAPAAGVDCLLRASWRVGPLWNHQFLEAKTGADGLAEIDLAPIRRDGAQLLVAATTAAGGAAFSQGYHRGVDETDPLKIYSHTDRPVYRPGQTVHFRSIVRVDSPEGYRAKSGVAVRVVISDPRGESRFDRTLVTNEWGSISADLTLPDEPTLGVWHVRTMVGERQYYTYSWTGAQFRVEEYKLPEFEVTVDAGEGRVAPGAEITAKVTARYYFGAPVVSGQATWRVFRQPYRHHIPVARRYPWYYEDLYPQPYPYYGEELVTEGSGLTDAEGRTTIAFTAKDYEDDSDSRYRIEVSVVDESRREIHGGAVVFATEKPFFVSLDPQRLLWKPGDSVVVAIRAEDANRRPAASEGKLVLQRRFDVEVEKDGEKKVVTEWRDAGEAPAKTGPDGAGTASIVVDAEGQYRLVYRTSAEGEEITGAAYVWVATADFPGSQYRFSGVEVVTDRDTYAVGDEMQVFVTSSFPAPTVLLTVEAGDRILFRKVLTAAGEAVLTKIRVTEAFTPNVFVKATAIRNEAVHMNTRQVIVPPVRKFLDVAVKPVEPKKDWRPGESADFELSAVDSTGEPVEAEFALAFFDKAVLYIQPDLTPDLAKFFYGAKRWDAVSLSSSFDFSHAGQEQRRPGKALTRYRSLGQPETMNPWFYTFHGFGGEIGEVVERLRARRAGSRGGPAESGMLFGADGRAADSGAGPPAPGASAEKSGGGDRGPVLRDSMESEEIQGADDGAAEAPVEARSFFPDAAFWSPSVVTGRNGKAVVTVKFPDSLTTWRAVARGATRTTEVGSAQGDYVVTKNIVMRLAAPRFFRERDEVVVSGIVHNYFDEALPVRIAIETDGGVLELLDRGELSRPDQTISVAAGGRQRVDWWFRVLRPGEATIVASARTERESDAVKRTFPGLEHGIEKFTGLSGGMTGDEPPAAELSFFVPEDRHELASELSVSVSPSLAATLLESLPFLADYPYGCVEQTLSRFLPTVVVKKTLLDLGYSLEDLGVAPERKVPVGYWGRPVTQKLKVLRDEDLKKAVAEGVKRLASFQAGDGSWSWFPGGSPDLRMTAYVVRGLALARAAGAEVDEGLVLRGAGFLVAQLRNTDPAERERKGMAMSPDLLVMVAGALLDAGRPAGETKELLERIVDFTWANREDLAAASRARLAIALLKLGRAEEAGIVCDNLTDFATIDRESGTARFGRVEGYYHWADDAVVGTAETLRAYLAVRANHELVPLMAKWLVANRRGASWKSTMDTAYAVLGLCDYLKASDELTPDLEVTVTIDDRVTKRMRITKENLFTFDGRLELRGADLAAGRHVVRIAKSGRGNLYYQAHLSVFTREEGVTAAASEIGIARAYYRVHQRTREVEREVFVKDHVEKRMVTEAYEELEPLAEGAELTVGDVVQVEMKLSAKNDYEYLVFSDAKAAGLETVDRTSGYAATGGLFAYRELRDERTDFFVSRLAQGEGHVLRYRLRAEIPGVFHAMPASGFAMYLPDVRAISNEAILSVTEPGVR